MIRHLAGIALFFVLGLSAQAEEFMPSTVEGLPFDNTHALSDGGDGWGGVYRGSAPGAGVAKLVEFGITDVLIYKNQTKTEVDDEIAALKDAGIGARRIHVFPMQWRDIADRTGACKLAVGALKVLQRVHADPSRSVFFHCTVGQDRTGMLAGLYRMAEDGWSQRRAFNQEMCRHGYAEGNPNKPAAVSAAIRSDLTPVFLHVARIIESARETGRVLSASLCDEIEAELPAKMPKCPRD